MGYCNRNRRGVYQPSYTTDDCVYDTVRSIVEAQDEVADDCCSTSCDYSIQQLRGKGNELDPRYTTIPFMLYCAGTCDPFIGSGVFRNTENNRNKAYFGCVETPVFRVKQFAKNSDWCVKLELLVPASDDGGIKSGCHDKSGGVCSFFSEENPVNCFLATGICLTVDLRHFMGITCLDPINPM